MAGICLSFNTAPPVPTKEDRARAFLQDFKSTVGTWTEDDGVVYVMFESTIWDGLTEEKQNALIAGFSAAYVTCSGDRPMEFYDSKMNRIRMDA